MKLRLAVLLTGAAATGHCEYQIFDMGALDGGASFAVALNSHGQMVGGVRRANGQWHAALWDNGALGDLGALGGYESQAWDINESGQVVGYARDWHWSKPFLWQSGQMVEIVGGGNQARGINSAGLVVTDRYGSAGVWFHLPDGNVAYVTGNGGANVTDVNDHGTAVGSDAIAGDPYSRAFAWTTTQTTLLQTPPAYRSEAWDISDTGIVCGQAGDRAAIWNNGQMAYLDDGTLFYSAAFGVNNAGVAVGAISGGGGQMAAMFSNGQVTKLNDLVTAPNWDFFSGIGISDSGVIVGDGSLNGQQRGFALVPHGVQWATVPEPEGLLVFASALTAFSSRLRRGRKKGRT